jgi:hypothetical protein
MNPRQVVSLIRRNLRWDGKKNEFYIDMYKIDHDYHLQNDKRHMDDHIKILQVVDDLRNKFIATCHLDEVVADHYYAEVLGFIKVLKLQIDVGWFTFKDVLDSYNQINDIKEDQPADETSPGDAGTLQQTGQDDPVIRPTWRPLIEKELFEAVVEHLANKKVLRRYQQCSGEETDCRYRWDSFMRSEI